jgi:PAS domain S-box-containing protein
MHSRMSDSGEPRGRTNYSLSDGRLLRDLLRFSSEGLVFSSLDNRRVLEISDAFAALMGYPRGEIVGRPWGEVDFIPLPGEADIQKLRASGSLRGPETELQTKTGDVVNAEYSAQLLRDDQGEYVLTVIRDITLQTRRLRSIEVLTDASLAQLELKELLDELLDRIRELLRADTAAILLLAEGGKELSVFAARGLEEEGEQGVRIPLGEGFAGRITSGGSPLAVDLADEGDVVDPLLRESGVSSLLGVPLLVGGAVLGILQIGTLAPRTFSGDDVRLLQLVADRAALAIDHSRARDQEHRLASINRAVLDATTEGIRLVDRDGNTLLTNQSMDAIAGDVLGLGGKGSMDDQVAALAEQTTDPEAYRAAVASFLADPELSAVNEYRLVESGRWLERQTMPVHGEAGELIGRLFVVRDVTAVREAEAVKTQIVATVAHELRSPLTGIIGFAELAVAEADPDTRADYLETISHEAKRLAGLVNQFLDLQRIQEGKFGLTIEPFDLGELLRHEIRLFRRRSAAHTLELALPDEGLLVLGERDRVGQVLDNLLSNAIKYSPEGGNVSVRASLRDGSAQVSVTDTGIGIPPDQHRHIFTRFFRVDSPTHTIGGTGLGLAFCREILTGMGGDIGFESDAGKGSSFWFRLPTASTEDGAPSLMV